ncbi:Os03g0296100, partial [Oryza sativa Japonica Group]
MLRVGRRGRVGVDVRDDLLLLMLMLQGGEVRRVVEHREAGRRRGAGGGRGADGERADALHEVGDGAVGDGVDATLPQLLAQLGVPVVLHVVVRPPRQLVRDQRPP